MTAHRSTWAIVLAGGDGTRLAALTTDAIGNSVPKQYCSLNGSPALIHQALQRAYRFAPRERVCAIVSRRHERHWRPLLRSVPGRNVIVEPRNCGTANGVLHCVLSILECDQHARVVFLPADHYVGDEDALANAVARAANSVSRIRNRLTLIGIQPDDTDPDLGYIVPGPPVNSDARRVEKFVEKPPTDVAQELIARGALWNSFIFAARATTLLALMRRRVPEVVAAMTSAFIPGEPRALREHGLEELYQRLPVIDFSRTIIQGAELALLVSTAPACGWTDLGTPQRVARILQRLPQAPARLAAGIQGQRRAAPDLAIRAAEFAAVAG
jgi:mannose-1-phosphate guanylyltransferase